MCKRRCEMQEEKENPVLSPEQLFGRRKCEAMTRLSPVHPRMQAYMQADGGAMGERLLVGFTSFRSSGEASYRILGAKGSPITCMSSTSNRRDVSIMRNRDRESLPLDMLKAYYN